jgi:hypothetical protein
MVKRGGEGREREREIDNKKITFIYFFKAISFGSFHLLVQRHEKKKKVKASK